MAIFPRSNFFPLTVSLNPDISFKLLHLQLSYRIYRIGSGRNFPFSFLPENARSWACEMDTSNYCWPVGKHAVLTNWRNFASTFLQFILKSDSQIVTITVAIRWHPFRYLDQILIPSKNVSYKIFDHHQVCWVNPPISPPGNSWNSGDEVARRYIIWISGYKIWINFCKIFLLKVPSFKPSFYCPSFYNSWNSEDWGEVIYSSEDIW